MVKFKGFNNKKESQSSSDRINLLRLQICSRLKKYDLRLHDYINSAVNFYEKKYS